MCVLLDMMDQKKRCFSVKVFKVETFLPVLDTVISELKKHAEAYSLIGNWFSFFSELKTIGSD